MASQYRLVGLVVLALLLGFFANGLFQRTPLEKSANHHRSADAVAPSAVETLLSDLSNTLKSMSLREHDEIEVSEEPVAAQSPKNVSVTVSLPGSQELLNEVRSLNNFLKKIVSASAINSQSAQLSAQSAPAQVAQQGSAPAVVAAPVASKRKDVITLGNGKCLDTNPSYKNNGIKVYACNQGLGQSFWLTAQNELKHGTGYCVDSEGGENGAVRVSYCSKKDSQIWEVLQPGRPGSPLRNKKNGLCLDYNMEESLVTAACSTGCSQRWIFSHSGAPASTAITTKKPAAPNSRLLCWVLTQPSEHAGKATAINNTWGRDCDILLFISTETYPGLNIVVVETGQDESRKILWMKTQQAWLYVYTHYKDKADWFFKIDDDAYVVVPYLREFFATLNPDTPAHYGRLLQYGGNPGADNTFVSGGSGMLLTRAAVRLLGKSVEQDPNVWAGPVNGPADLLTSKTLYKLGVPAGDSRDAIGRHRFLTLGIETERTITRAKNPDVWLWKYSSDTLEGEKCCSPRWISTHYIKLNQMYSLYDMLQVGCAMNMKSFPFLEPPKLP